MLRPPPTECLFSGEIDAYHRGAHTSVVGDTLPVNQPLELFEPLAERNSNDRRRTSRFDDPRLP